MEKELKMKDWGPPLRYYWRFTWPVMRKIWYVWPLWLVLILSQMIEPYIYRNVFDELAKIAGVGETFEVETIVFFITLWAVIMLVSAALMTLVRMMFAHRMPLVDRSYFLMAVQRVLDLDMSYHLEKKSGEMMKKIDRAVDSFWTITFMIVVNVVPKLILALGVLIWAMTINWVMTLVSVSLYPLAIWVVFLGLKKTNQLQNKSNTLFDSAIGRAYDAVANIMVVKSFAQEGKERRRFMGKYEKYVKLQQKTSVRWGRIDVWSGAISTMQVIIIISVGAYLMVQGEFTLGQVVMFHTFRRYLYDPLYAIGWDMRHFQFAVLRLEEARKILDREDSVKDLPEAPDLRVKQGLVEMRDVSFKYQKVGVLSRVNIVFEPGKATALVGHSGAGKSTVTALLNRFYDLQKGKILIDGQDIRKVSQRSLHKNIGLVMQENTLFNDTIYNNIAYARPGCRRAAVYEAAKKANIHDFIMSLPKKYKTVVGERGLKLSGGEKQRVAIARVVLKNPPILILDEATSALDSKNEKVIHQALQQVMKGRTSIVIAHRLSTVVDVDKIVVIDKGRVVQQGTHRQLTRQEGVYKDLVDLQVGGLLPK